MARKGGVTIRGMITLIKWETREYHHSPKTHDWYWAVGIITVTLAVIAILLGNLIFALFIILSGVALCIHATIPSHITECQISNKGIMFKNVLFPYTTLDTFWVETLQSYPKLLVKSKKFFMPHIVIPIETVDPDKVRALLLAYMKEEEEHESLGLRFMQYLGF